MSNVSAPGHVQERVPSPASPRCVEPDAVLSDWRELVRQHPHIHGPEAAARVGVTEAALLAARIGHGATELHTDLAELLAPLPCWGKVLIAARTDLGVMLDILHVQHVSRTGTALAVGGDEHEIVIGCDEVDRCYLLEDHDTHGHTYSINWFDAQGQVLGRVFLFSKTERREALEHVGRCTRADAVRAWVPGSVASPEYRRIRGRAGEEILVGFGEHAATIALRAVLSCSRWPAMQLEMEGRGGAHRHTGALEKSSETPPSAHATGPGCKLHARPRHARHAFRVQGVEGRAGLRFQDSNGGSLTLTPQVEPKAAARWVGDLIAGAAS